MGVLRTAAAVKKRGVGAAEARREPPCPLIWAASKKKEVGLDAHIPLWEYTCDCIYEPGPNLPVPV
jgi:hypothetical protein